MYWRLLAALCALYLSAVAFAIPTTIRMMAGRSYGIPPKEGTSTNVVVRRAVFDAFRKAHPDIQVVNAGGLNLVGDSADNMFLMSMAGDSAPDVFYVNFRQYYSFLEQGFCRPLDDLIRQDPEVNARINPTVLKVLQSYDGHVYAIPFFQVALALYYRRDYFLEAGLDPAKPPRTWAEFRDACRKIVQSAPGRYGWETSGSDPSYHWQNFLYQAGGEVVQPGSNGRWQATIASEAGVKALDFYGQLMTQTWRGTDGKTYGPACSAAQDYSGDIRIGKAAMWFGYTNDVVMQSQSDIPPSLIGMAALPAGPAGTKNEINAGMWAINARLKDPKKIEACWKFIKYFSGDEAARVNTKKCVELGIGNLVNPTWLKKFGYSDLLATVDPSYVTANEALFTTGHPEPYGKNCQQVYSVLDHALQRRVLEKSTPTMTILQEVQAEMNRQLLDYTPPDVMAARRGWATGIAICLGLGLIGAAISGWRRLKVAMRVEEQLPAGTDRKKVYRFVGLCLAPAAASILIWSYLPLFRGLIIAFQNYTLMNGSTWVGLDNFISAFTYSVFYQSLWNSFEFVGLSIGIGFFIPIFLAIALNEIPWGRVFFRTVFYLPAMTSSFVVALVWRQFYDKDSSGLLNSLLRPLLENVINPLRVGTGHAPFPLANDWLGNPSLAMFAVVLPGIWAGAGAGSILYLAALKSISLERYEAADLDGAGWWQKIRYITLPGLKPLILINLLGVFIGGFKAMEGIFALTQGGPLNATRTIGLEVWQNAFMFLKFGYATAAAWVMGSILIGFTLIQIRTLLRMRFGTSGG